MLPNGGCHRLPACLGFLHSFLGAIRPAPTASAPPSGSQGHGRGHSPGSLAEEDPECLPQAAYGGTRVGAI